MYFQDHNHLYFHAEYQGMKAEYGIKSLEVLAGNLPNRAHVLELEWASQHRVQLLENWEKSQIPAPLERIEPLD